MRKVIACFLALLVLTASAFCVSAESGPNLLDLSRFTLKTDNYDKNTAVYVDGKIVVHNENTWAGTALIFFDNVLPPGKYRVTLNGATRLLSDSDEIPNALFNSTYNKYGLPYYTNSNLSVYVFTATKYFRLGVVCAEGDSVVYPRAEFVNMDTGAYVGLKLLANDAFEWFNWPMIANILLVVVGACVCLFIFWWGCRKVGGAIVRAFKRGRFSV